MRKCAIDVTAETFFSFFFISKQISDQIGYPRLRKSDFAKVGLRQKKWGQSFSPPFEMLAKSNWRSPTLTPKWFKIWKRYALATDYFGMQTEDDWRLYFNSNYMSHIELTILKYCNVCGTQSRANFKGKFLSGLMRALAHRDKSRWRPIRNQIR